MKCGICKQGDTHPGFTTVTVGRGPTIVVIKQVPAELCENCGEHYLSEEASRRVLAMGEEAVKHNAEVEVLRYAA